MTMIYLYSLSIVSHGKQTMLATYCQIKIGNVEL